MTRTPSPPPGTQTSPPPFPRALDNSQPPSPKMATLPTMPATTISIRAATLADLPALIALTCAATETQLMTRFLFGHRPDDAVRAQTASLTASLGARASRTRPTGATSSRPWTTRRRAPSSAGPSDTTAAAAPPDFPAHIAGEIRRSWVRVTGGKAHVVIGALYVRPDRQGEGIGRQLVAHLDATYGLEDELVMVSTRADAEAFYARLGWVVAG
ncbi:hypothetical protein MMC32_001839, partial [Xylographa parallela]|nr:hypothetical protein [Xylographa parallela]